MDNDRIKGNWLQFKGQLREAYGDLTDDEIEQTKGQREKIEGLLMEKAGEAKDEARASVDKMLSSI